MKATKFRSKETAAILRKVAKLAPGLDGADLWAAFVRLAAQDVRPFLSPANDRERRTTACAERDLREGIAVFLGQWFPAAKGIGSYLDAKEAGCTEDYRMSQETGRDHFHAIIETARREDFAPEQTPAAFDIDACAKSAMEAMARAKQAGFDVNQSTVAGKSVFQVGYPGADPLAEAPDLVKAVDKALARAFKVAGIPATAHNEARGEDTMLCVVTVAGKSYEAETLAEAVALAEAGLSAAPRLMVQAECSTEAEAAKRAGEIIGGGFYQAAPDAAGKWLVFSCQELSEKLGAVKSPYPLAVDPKDGCLHTVQDFFNVGAVSYNYVQNGKHVGYCPSQWCEPWALEFNKAAIALDIAREQQTPPAGAEAGETEAPAPWKSSDPSPGMANFVADREVRDFDRSTENGIMTFDNPKENPTPFRYFVRVGGGYRGFKGKREAVAYYKAD